MWIFTKHGFYSATLSTTTRGHIQVRARTKEHLQRLMDALPDELKQSKIIETPNADYRWRIVMTPSKWTVCMMKLSEDIDYSNFKNACKAHGLDTYPHHQVWHIMHSLQLDEKRAETADFTRGALPGIAEWAEHEGADAEHDEADDGQCPDCRVDYVLDADQSGEHCPHCGFSREYFQAIAAQKLAGE